MSANSTLGVDDCNSDVKEDSLPTTTSVLDRSKSLFGNSSDAPIAAAKNSANLTNEGSTNVSDAVENSGHTDEAEATTKEDTIPSSVSTEKEEPMDSSDAQSPTADVSPDPTQELFEKKTISMDTFKSDHAQNNHSSATLEDKVEEESEDHVVEKGTEERKNIDDTDGFVENNDETVKNEVVAEGDAEKVCSDEDVDAAHDEDKVKTDEELEEEDEEEEEVPKKKPKRAVVDDDETSDEQTVDASSMDNIDSVEADSTASQGEMEVASHVSSIRSEDISPTPETTTQDSSCSTAQTSQEGNAAETSAIQGETLDPLQDTSSVSNHTSEGVPDKMEGIANEPEEARVTEEQTEAVVNTEPTSSRSTRSRITSTAAETPTSSVTPRRGGRSRQLQSLAENEIPAHGAVTPMRRGRSSRGANADEAEQVQEEEEQQIEVEDTNESPQKGKSKRAATKREKAEQVVEAEPVAEGQEEEKDETPKRSGRSKRLVTSTSVEPTPRSARGKGRKSEATEEITESSVEVHDDETIASSFTRSPRKSRSAVKGDDSVHQEDSAVANGPTSSRRSTRAKAPAKSAPATPATNRRTPARGRKMDVSITEETAEDVGESDETPVSKRGGRRKSAPSATKTTDEHDPYDIDTEMEHHPEPLKNIHFQMEVQSFGAVKYAKTGESGSKYSKTEKTAESRVADLQTTPEGNNKRSLADMTPGKEKKKRSSTGTGGRKPRVKKEQTQVNEVVMEDVSQIDSNEISSAPNRSRKRKSEISEVLTPPAKRDQAVVLKMLNDEEQLLADHPEDENGPHAPGARVYAIFQKTFYPAVILAERDGLGRYKLQFTADNVVKDVPNSGVIPLRILEAGKNAFYNDEEVRLHTTPNDISAGEWAKGKLGIALLNEDGEPTEETKTVDWNEISFDQSEWREYIRSLEQNATAIVKSNITTISEASRSRKPTATPQATKPRTRKKKSEDVASSRGASASPIDEDELLPMKPEAIGKNIFSGKVFMLTSASRSSASTVQSMFKKKNLMTFIEQNGGIVTEHLNDFEDRFPGCQPLLISDTYYRTHKYLAALARAIPCVSNTWLRACGEHGECVDYASFVLPAGASIFGGCEDMPAPKNPSGLLADKKIYVHSTHSVREVTQTGPGGTFVEIWKPILELLGATVVEADYQTLKGSDVTFDVALVDGTFQEDVMDFAKSIGASRVTSEWVIQTIILGRAPDPTGHTKFDPYRLHHRPRN